MARAPHIAAVPEGEGHTQPAKGKRKDFPWFALLGGVAVGAVGYHVAVRTTMGLMDRRNDAHSLINQGRAIMGAGDE